MLQFSRICQEPAKNLPGNILVHDGTDAHSAIHLERIAKQSTVRQTPNAEAAVCGPRGVLDTSKQINRWTYKGYKQMNKLINRSGTD